MECNPCDTRGTTVLKLLPAKKQPEVFRYFYTGFSNKLHPLRQKLSNRNPSFKHPPTKNGDGQQKHNKDYRISVLRAKEAHKKSRDLKYGPLCFLSSNEGCNIVDEIRTLWAVIPREA